MILESDKVYKVEHCTPFRKRKYIIFSPLKDIKVPDDYFGNNEFMPKYDNIRHINTHFTICFDGSILTEFDIVRDKPFQPQTGIDCACKLLPLCLKDLEEIRMTIKQMGHGYKYNRKLNKIYTKDDIGEGQSL